PIPDCRRVITRLGVSAEPDIALQPHRYGSARRRSWDPVSLSQNVLPAEFHRNRAPRSDMRLRVRSRHRGPTRPRA
ncbi:hypothetical protein PBRA_000296, partial [Plasmodiophora brassicae]